jgi:hypothetical protein
MTERYLVKHLAPHPESGGSREVSESYFDAYSDQEAEVIARRRSSRQVTHYAIYKQVTMRELPKYWRRKDTPRFLNLKQVYFEQ